MGCVTCVRYAVRVNGELTDPVISSRGIRQGDLISHYLFFLWGLVYSSNVRTEVSSKVSKNGRIGPPISHLLFADDNIFFARSNSTSVEALKATSSTYCEGSRQKINLEKSSVFFGNRCDAH
jgi:hypothetical protein